jgi:sugar porter (SP) family MFS transporter
LHVVNVNYPYLLTISVVTALGGLLFGFDISVISGTIPFIQEFFGLSEAMKGWVVSSALLGCILGASQVGKLGDRFGRKKVLFVTAVLFAVSAVGTALAGSIPGFVFYRILGGLAVGGASVLAPVYIAEISPAGVRGRMVSINQLTIVIGISLAYYSNYLLLPLGENAWRWMFAAEAVPAFVFMVSLFVIPESPRWLTARGRADGARQVLGRIAGLEFAIRELAEITASLQGKRPGANLPEVLQKRYRLVLLLGIFLAVFQQWSGINVIFFYAPDIFARARFGIDDALFQTTLIGVINILFTLLAMAVIDRFGRKFMMLIGSAGMAACYLVIGFLFLTDNANGAPMIAALLAAPAFFAFGLGPTVWVVISEIFPNRIRGVAMSVATFALWSACYLLTLTFPIFVEVFNAANTFWLYAVICAGGVYVIYRFLPETKGVSLEELERKLSPLNAVE